MDTRAIQSLILMGSYNHPWLGITVLDLTLSTIDAMNLPKGIKARVFYFFPLIKGVKEANEAYETALITSLSDMTPTILSPSKTSSWDI